MAKEIILPKLGMDMSSGTIMDWFVEEGDRVKKGEPLLEVMTDKVSIEVEAEESGIILKIIGEIDKEYPVYSVIGYIGEEGEWIPGNESTEAFVDHLEKIGIKSKEDAIPKIKAAESVEKTEKKTEVRKADYEMRIDERLPKEYLQNDFYLEGEHVLQEESVEAKQKLFDEIKSGQLRSVKVQENVPEHGHIRMTPSARRLMREVGIEPETVMATGPKGRIQVADVEKTISTIKAKGYLPQYEPAMIETALETLDGHPENTGKKKKYFRTKDRSIKEMLKKEVVLDKTENEKKQPIRHKNRQRSELDFVPFVENGITDLRDEIIVKPTQIKADEVKVRTKDETPNWVMPQTDKYEPVTEETEAVETEMQAEVDRQEDLVESDQNDEVITTEKIAPTDEQEGPPDEEPRIDKAEKEKQRMLEMRKQTEAEKADVLKAIQEAQAEKIKMMEAIKAAEAEKEEVIRVLKEAREKEELEKAERMRQDKDRIEILAKEAKELAQQLVEEEKSSRAKVESSNENKIEETAKQLIDTSAVTSVKKAPEEEVEMIKEGTPLSGKRKIIAERMQKSHLENAVITLTVEIDMSEIKELRRKITKKIEEQVNYRCTYTDFLLMATARALIKHEVINSRLENDRIIAHEAVNLGLAVGQDDGLIVPVIKNTQSMNFVQMVQARGETLKKIKSKKYIQDDLKGSTFTITNLGMYGVHDFTAIINQPNSAILSVGEVVQRMRIIHSEPQIRSVMKVSLNLDHRVADGMAGAKFLEDLKADMENPSLLLF